MVSSGRDEALVDKRGHQVQDLGRFDFLPSADPLGRLQSAAAGKARHPLQQRLLPSRSAGRNSIEQRTESPVARHGRTRAARQPTRGNGPGGDRSLRATSHAAVAPRALSQAEFRRGVGTRRPTRLRFRPSRENAVVSPVPGRRTGAPTRLSAVRWAQASSCHQERRATGRGMSLRPRCRVARDLS